MQIINNLVHHLLLCLIQDNRLFLIVYYLKISLILMSLCLRNVGDDDGVFVEWVSFDKVLLYFYDDGCICDQ